MGAADPGARVRTSPFLAPGIAFALALFARLAQLIHGGAMVGLSAYDQSVYYAAADALMHGRAPYTGDFVLLHPPGIVLVGLPFALLGRLTSDPVGFLAESIAFGAMGACTAALIVVVARRAGASTWAALGGGVVYAAWSVTVAASASVRHEPLGDLLMVASLFLLLPGREASPRRRALAGALFGLLVNVKVWWAVPIVVVFLLTLPRRPRLRDIAPAPVAALLTALAVDLPFWVASHGHMFASVISVQLGRPDVQLTPSGDVARLSTLVRLEQLTGVEGAVSSLFGSTRSHADLVRVVTLVVCALAVLTAALALRTALGRVMVPVLATQVLVLLTAPIYFPYYGDFVGVAFALVVCCALSRRAPGWSPGRLPWLALWPVGAAVSLVLLLTASQPPIVASPPNTTALARATRDIPCIVADSPRLLIALDALDRSFEHGCRNVVDFQGVAHGGGPDPRAQARGPGSRRAWKRFVTRYLGSGDAVALSAPGVRRSLGPAPTRRLTRGPVIARSGTVTIYRTVRPTPRANE